MTNKELVEQYNKLNNSYKKTLVFRLGMEAGFFSEYNNMILAMLYCLTNNIKFVLYSEQANFSYKKGWSDFFRSFCAETDKEYHKKYNHRYPGAYFSRIDRLKIRYYKLTEGVDYFTHELWHSIRDKKYFESRQYDIPELGINGDLNDACRVLVNLTWQYNKDTEQEIKQIQESISLPENYLGFHIRKGDKVLETELEETRSYVNMATGLVAVRNVFVLTDDYDVVSELKKIVPDWSIYTLCGEDEHGYVHADFQKQDKNNIKKAHLKLFASIDVLSKGEIFIGTFGSNPGMYLGMRMPRGRAYGLDSEKWEIY